MPEVWGVPERGPEQFPVTGQFHLVSAVYVSLAEVTVPSSV